MTTYTALTVAQDESTAYALGDAVEALHPDLQALAVLEIEDGAGRWEVGAYFAARPDDTALDLLAAAHGAAPFVISAVEDRDWVAQVRRELSPVRAGRFVVHGGHDRGAADGALIGLEIEAAMAFGTGHHDTTRGCLLALEALARRGLVARRTADVGCGTGVLAMAAAKLWRRRVTATDIDPVAVATARANVIANGVAPWVRTGRAVGLRGDLHAAEGPYDLIFANILARPLRRLAPDVAAALAPGGAVILSGILNRQAAGVEATYRSHGLMRLAALRLGDWTTLTFRRP